MIRVLQVLTIMNRGGAESMIMNYYRSIDKSKIQFDFLVHRNEKGDFDDEIEKLGGKIYRAFPIRPGKYHRYKKFLNSFLDEHSEYKIIHSHINENSGFILSIAKKKGIPVRIAHSHIATLGIDYKFIFRQYARLYLKNSTTHNFACGDEAGKWLFKKEKFSIMKNAIDSDVFDYNPMIRKEYRKKFKLENNFVIGHIGRFGYQKNHTFLIDIFNEIVKIKPNSKLILVGVGELQAEIRNKVSSLELQKNVIFLNLRSDVSNLLQMFDIFLFPSLFEGLSVAAVEAQAAGLRCFLSDTISYETSVTDQVRYLSLNLSPKKWAQEICDVADYYRKSSKLEIINSGYDININAKKLVDFYLDSVKLK